VKAVKTFFVLHPQNDKGTGSQTHRQTGDIDSGIDAAAAQIAQNDFEIVKHD
jgi:hypothetical protein